MNLIKISIVLVGVLFMHPLQAQICTGSLGDPIINITFGSGPNPGAALSSATTNYQYITADCPQDGFYSVRNSTNACFGNTWHTITDHTGDANGYFMLVNASVSPGAFYLDTVKGLCANTTYEFAAWILNILQPSSCGGSGIRPNLTFKLEKTDGTLLQSYSTNDILPSASPQWKQFGFFFTVPADATNVVVRIINNSQGGCGNDLALDDITFRPCGPQISASINGALSNSVSLCEGNAGTYSFSSSVSTGFNRPSVQWQESFNGAAWTDIAGATFLYYSKTFSATASSGRYMFRVMAAETGNINSLQCRVASLPLTVNVISNPLPNASVNTPVCEGAPLVLMARGNYAVWSGPNGFTDTGTNITISNTLQSHSGVYYVNVVNNSCFRSDSVSVEVHPAPSINIDKSEIEICEGDTAQLSISGADNYTWVPQAGLSLIGSTLFVHPMDSTLFVVSGLNGFGCSDTLSLNANLLLKPLADAGKDVSIMEGDAIALSGSAKGDRIYYYWTPNADITGVQTLSPIVNPKAVTTYILHVVSMAGCGTHIDAVSVNVYKKLLIPNSFSPNGDGINDKWNIGGIETYPGAKVGIFNRYGQQVYTTSDFKGWDGTSGGKRLSPGIYYYVLSFINQLREIAGWVLIVQ
jgi:gliding motility-associated-like protein